MPGGEGVYWAVHMIVVDSLGEFASLGMGKIAAGTLDVRNSEQIASSDMAVEMDPLRHH